MRFRPPEPSESPSPDPIADTAAVWLARRDRGLSAAEQDNYLEWLRADPRHGAAISRIEKAWGALDSLAEWRPAHSQQPNPDLLAVRRRRWPWTAALAIAAALAVVFTFTWTHRTPSAALPQVVRHSEMRVLPDGSQVELNHGAEIAVEFTADERRIRLVRGEAHFTVQKARAPFVVMAGDVRVRAVGTVFNVRLADDAVDVLVTEGKVRIDPPRFDDPALTLALNAVMLEARERARVDLVTRTPAPPHVEAASAAEIERALAWQGLRINFNATPLGDAIEQFNRHSVDRIVLGDRQLAALRIDGNFRADHAESFVWLLSQSPNFGVTVERDEQGRYVLRAR